MADYIMAADLGGSRIRLILSNHEAVNLADEIVPLVDGMTVDDVNAETVKAAKTLMDSKGLSASDVMGATIGSAGVPDQEEKILTESPNVPKSTDGIIAVIPALIKAFGWKYAYVNNDCSTAAECAKRFGHKRQEIKPGDPYASKPYAYRFANRPGDDTEEDYFVVMYWTISSGTNIGIKIGDLLYKGEFGTIPEFGHQFHVEKDPFENDMVCGDGAVGHLEPVISGGGIAKIMRNAVKSGGISSGSLYDKIVNEKKDQKLPVVLFDTLEDENAKKIVDFLSLNLARVLGAIIVCYGPGKIEIGGGVMKSFEHVLVPAVKMLDENVNNTFYLQRGKTSLPDICVAKDYGNDYVWRGAIAGFLAELT
ncbi:ROK family protein [Candidatus Poribacteria bacterium]|nr:ROK family protein [Candidatus Poribacteria bacterium]